MAIVPRMREQLREAMKAREAIRTNFLRLKMQHGLYVQKTNGVTLLTPTVFRASRSKASSTRAAHST